LSRGRGVPAGAVIFFALLAATLAIAVLVIRARTPDLVLEVLKPEKSIDFSPDAVEGRHLARFTFFVRRSDDAARVTIVDSHEDVVKTLDQSVSLESDEPVTYAWDGTTDAGALAKPGRYRLGVELPDADREMVWPIRVTLHEGEDELSAAHRGKPGASN